MVPAVPAPARNHDDTLMDSIMGSFRVEISLPGKFKSSNFLAFFQKLKEGFSNFRRKWLDA